MMSADSGAASSQPTPTIDGKVPNNWNDVWRLIPPGRPPKQSYHKECVEPIRAPDSVALVGVDDEQLERIHYFHSENVSGMSDLLLNWSSPDTTRVRLVEVWCSGVLGETDESQYDRYRRGEPGAVDLSGLLCLRRWRQTGGVPDPLGPVILFAADVSGCYPHGW